MAPNIHNITPWVVREITTHLDAKDVLRLSSVTQSLSHIRHWVYTKNIVEDNSSIIHVVAERGKVETLKLIEQIQGEKEHLKVNWEKSSNACVVPNAADHLKANGLRGWTPIHVAAYFGNQDVVALLAKRGKGIHSEDETEPVARTPMFYAALSKEPGAMIKFMQGLGCDVNQVITSNGLTLLAYFCLKKNPDAALALINAGARVDYKYPGDNKNLIHLCCAYEIFDMANFEKFRRPPREKLPDESESDSDRYSEVEYDEPNKQEFLEKFAMKAIAKDPDTYLDDYVKENDFWRGAGKALDHSGNEAEYTQSTSTRFDAEVFDRLITRLINKGVNARAIDATGGTPAHYAVLLPSEDAYWNVMESLKDGGEEFMTETLTKDYAVTTLAFEGDRDSLEDYDDRILFFINHTSISMELIDPNAFRLDWGEIGAQLQRDGRYEDFDILRSQMSIENEEAMLDAFDRHWGVGTCADD